MRTRWMILSVFVALFAVSTTQAGLLRSGITLAEDQDYESAFLVGGGTTLGDGDFLFAIAEFPNLYTANPADTDQYYNGDGTKKTLTSISILKVDGAPVITGGVVASYTFTQPTKAEWTAILSGLGLAGADLAAALPTSDAGAIQITYLDPAPSATDVNAPHLDTKAGDSLADGVKSATEGTRYWEFGFNGSANEFFVTDTIDVGGSPTDITQIDSLNGFASLSLLHQNGGGQLAKHNYLGAVRTNPPPEAIFTGPNHLQLQTNKGTHATGSWALPTDTDAYIQAIPEPSSFAIYGLLMGIGAFTAVRRRKKAKAA